jgi:hypothetical protein
MTTTINPRPTASTSRLSSPPRRSVPHLVVGALLVTSCTAGGVWWSTVAGDRHPALALARPLALGDVLEPGDLREVSIAVDGTVDAVPATDKASIVGQRLAVSLPAGALLPRGALGAVVGPADGRAVAALALEPGQAPPDVTAGVAVLVVLGTSPEANRGGTSQPSSAWRGLVTSITAVDDPTRVVSVELAEPDARRVAAAPTGMLSLVVVPGGDR